MMATGRDVWFSDETTIDEIPPVRDLGTTRGAGGRGDEWAQPSPGASWDIDSDHG